MVMAPISVMKCLLKCLCFTQYTSITNMFLAIFSGTNKINTVEFIPLLYF